MKSRSFGVLALSAALLTPALALAWSQEAPFGARVHKHEFSRAVLEGKDCTLKVRLFFDAPEEAYKDEAPGRNYYRFHARINFDSNHSVTTRIFHNDAPGAREYDYEQDTSNEGCWAKAANHAHSVDVEGCRGRGCKPEDFK